MARSFLRAFRKRPYPLWGQSWEFRHESTVMTPQTRAACRIATEIRQARTALAVARARSDVTGITNAKKPSGCLLHPYRAELTAAVSAEAAVRSSLSAAQTAVASATSGLSSAQSAFSSVGSAQSTFQSALDVMWASPDLGLGIQVSSYFTAKASFNSAVSSFVSGCSSLNSAATSLGNALQSRVDSAIGVAIETAGVSTVQGIIDEVV